MSKKLTVSYRLFAVLCLIPFGLIAWQTASLWYVMIYDAWRGIPFNPKELALAVTFSCFLFIILLLLLVTLLKYRKNICERALLTVLTVFCFSLVCFVAVLDMLSIYMYQLLYKPDIGIIIYSAVTAIIFIGLLVLIARLLFVKNEPSRWVKIVCICSSAAISVLAVLAIIFWFAFELVPFWLY